MKLAYYPGCSLHSTSAEYDQSTQWVCKNLGITYEEIPDWNCCGATSAHALDHELSIALPARNLVLAEQMGADELVAPCAACFSRMKSAEIAMRTDNALRDAINPQLPQPYQGSVTVKSMLELLSSPEIQEKVRSSVKRPLKNLKLACYYGCLLVRPPKIAAFDDPENPQSMDQLMTAAGAECVEWPYKTECCGGSFSITRRDIVGKLVSDILYMAKHSGADAIVTACPLCQTNLDTRQDLASQIRGEDFNIPVYFFTELLAFALGASEGELSLGKHFIDAKSALRR